MLNNDESNEEVDEALALDALFHAIGANDEAVSNDESNEDVDEALT